MADHGKLCRFGRALTTAALAAGDNVLATARDSSQLLDLDSTRSDRLRVTDLDVTDAGAARAAVDLAVKEFGRLDIVANNAGYADSAPIEFTSIDDFRAQIETNLFGVVHVTQSALPVFRRQRSGHFLQFSSIGGRVGGTPGLAAYQSSKFAVEGFSEVLNAEVAPFGVTVTIIEPGGFRTEWGSNSMHTAPVEPDYEPSVGKANQHRETTVQQWAGDPERAATIIVDLTRLEAPRLGCCSERARWSPPANPQWPAPPKPRSGPRSAGQRISRQTNHDSDDAHRVTRPLSAHLVPVLVFIGLVVAAIGSLGAPLIPSVAKHDSVSLSAAQWTLTITLLTGALATPVLARLGEGSHRRRAIVATLVIVVVGSIVTVLPFGFTGLLIGRALQGVGVGLTSLVIGVARDELAGRRAASVIGLLSVTSVAGIGLGYPLAGLLTQYGGLEAAYGGGLLVAICALLAGLLVLPPDHDRPEVRTDILGVALLGVAVTGLLVAITEASARALTGWALVMVVCACVAIGAWWVRHELSTDQPLVDLRQLRVPTVVIADATVLLAGVGLYLLLSLSSRYVQTPMSAGYGVHGGVITAGLVLIPFSLFSFIASRINPSLKRKIPSAALIPLACLVVVSAALVFATVRGDIWDVLIVMALTGLGVGTLFATIPALILDSVPAAETTSAIGFNQVLRTIGVTIGSALCGILLQAATPTNATIPADHGYTTAATLGAAVLLVTTLAGIAAAYLTRKRPGSSATSVRSATEDAPIGSRTNRARTPRHEAAVPRLPGEHPLKAGCHRIDVLDPAASERRYLRSLRNGSAVDSAAETRRADVELATPDRRPMTTLSTVARTMRSS